MAPPDHEVILKSRAELDITDAAAVARALEATEADWIVNGAAYTAVDLAEDQPASAQLINDTAVAGLANAAAAVGARLLHLSTDFVFDGASGRAYLPTDPTHPLSVYGRTKLAGEGHVLADQRGIVLRTAWVYAAEGRNFVLTMLRLMRERENVWCKVTCPERLSVSGPPDFTDTVPFARRVVDEFPDRVLWGTDWPHPNLKGFMPDDGKIVDFIPRIAPSEELQAKLLVDNPARLYWEQN